MSDNQEQTKIEITQDKLVDLLLHAATREDIAKLASDSKAESVELRNELKEAILEFKRALDSLEAG